MGQPKVIVLRAPGTNCDEETAFAFERAGARAERIHINRLLERPTLIDDFQVLCLPGGFSYGDDVAAGRILATQMRRYLADALMRFRDAGKLVLGICNGFQVLIKSGILLEDSAAGLPAATLTWNDSGRYQDRWVNLKADNSRCVFMKGIDSLYLPIAHAEGKFVPQDDATLSALESAGQLALRYASSNGQGADPLPFPENPNGSVANVAGVCDPSGRILGLMPHPERYVDPTQHPRWTREGLQHEADGTAIFRNAVEFFTD